ncbi:FtsK/SpoIIIE family protein [Mycobacteroides abscessus subsp. massiliense]|uniref:FtsK/SpoIIIE family protein n=1 Tax=Mycobacteroides abscessus subsp. bolletii 50594 TaxID=1303024 RepID=A0AB33A5E7_9MYCO|nr:FtsK/SpoIIIE family protein [Mycobacteroides abscessus subsp. bolletii 50594]SHX53354.1 FtsK/SpoIIIE family protein [Mycobacteroides abscessus subsp. abscessus]SKM75326.1 FtsK/SpoIIIE family protein [Mycobacteroides abscessus subsp. massiliense]SKM77545.1 DNA segregation ATPase, FtsK/SpoIIIE family [Mycobacteroides abscessus subsp. massiliense]SKM87947.1 FtsK/SpoIIIE family protein [Mycobacteroides abscessus subsp. massiliense]
MVRVTRDARRAALNRKHERRQDFMWQRDVRIADANSLAILKDGEKADIEREKLSEKLESIAQRAALDAQRAVAERDKVWSAEEKRILSQPRTVRTGGSAAVGPIWFTHWRAALPAGLATRLGVSTSDAGPVFVLKPGGGISESDVISAVVRCEAPELSNDPTFIAWADGVESLLPGIARRYAVLERVRDDAWLSRLLEAAGVTTTEIRVEQISGEYGVYERKLSAVDVPSLVGAEADESGLVLRFAHRTGDSADKWSKGIAALRSGFSAAGVKSENLRVLDGPEGTVELRFDDAEGSFPIAVAPPVPSAVRSVAEAVKNYRDLHWEFGVDARGNTLRSRVADSPHVALIAQTGWGKSVLSATIIEQMRVGGAEVMLFDGKGTDHPRALGRQPGVIWLSKESGEHVVGMTWLHDEMTERYRQVDADNDGPDSVKSFDFPPIIALVDELPSLRRAVAKLDAKDKGRAFDSMLVDLLQKGRQARIHILLISTTLLVDAVPSDMQNNITRTIFLGPVDSRSLMDDSIPQSARERIVSLSSRIPESAKGRGVFMSRTPKGTHVIQFQSFYGYSPGNTSLDAAPTPEVREAWAQAREASESLPSLYDRIGIEVSGPGWRLVLMSELMNTPTVVVADEHGPVEGREIYDPLSPAFLGRVQSDGTRQRARGRGAVQSAPQPESRDVTALSATEAEPAKPALTPRKRTTPAPEKKVETVTETSARPAPRTDLDGW